MATGASTANLAIILIDARYGVLPQSRRHAFIASLLGIPHLVVAVNKMDLMEFREDVFNAIRDEFRAFAAQLRRCRATSLTSPSARSMAITWSTAARARPGTTGRRCSSTWRPCPSRATST